MKRSHGFACATLLVLVCLTSAARADHEAELWTRVGLRYRAAKRWRLILDQYVRFGFNPTQVVDIMPDGAVDYAVKKWLHLRVGYRYREQRDKNDEFVTSHRIYGDAALDEKVSKIRLGYRLRYQDEFSFDCSKDAFGNEDCPETKRTLRNKIAVGWDTDTFVEPELSAELFLRLGGRDGTGLQKYRVTAGANFQLGDHDFTLFYRFEDKIRDTNDPFLNILGISYAYSL